MRTPRRDLWLSVQAKALLPFLVCLGLAAAAAAVVVSKGSLAVLAGVPRAPLALAAGGIAASAAVVWYFAWRLSRRLRQLRDLAFAIGGGDFSKRAEGFPNDECGDLAEAINRMSENLQASRLRLEKAAEALEATQAQLVQSEKLSAVGQFIAGVAHELNNPLTVVIGYSDLLVETQADEKLRARLERISKSAHRCHKIVANLLGFARIQGQVRKLTQVNHILDEVIELMAYDLRTSNVDAIRDYQANLPPILADPHQLQQVFVNLVGNARQAIEAFRRDGRIILRTRVKEGYVRVEIADNGPGIAPENIRRIFEPFFTTKPVGKGTGLGLSLVFEILQKHSGRINVESEPGRGATFIVELPISAEQDAAGGDGARPVARELKPAGSSGKMILVVDDEEWILTLAKELLGSVGHAVEIAMDGGEALEAVERRNFDAVVCDWKMPGMDGVAFYEAVRTARPELLERFLFMSGDIIDESFQEFLGRSERKCIAKPFPIEEFRDEVEKLLLR